MILTAKTLLVLSAFLLVVFLSLSELDFSEKDEGAIVTIGGLLVVLFGFVAGALQ